MQSCSFLWQACRQRRGKASAFTRVTAQWRSSVCAFFHSLILSFLFGILLAKHWFCLHSRFWTTRKNRTKSPRWHFWAPRGFSLLRTLSADNERVAKQKIELKTLFCQAKIAKQSAFLPKSACFDSESPQAKNQTRHASMLNEARLVWKRPVLRWHFRRISQPFLILRNVTYWKQNTQIAYTSKWDSRLHG